MGSAILTTLFGGNLTLLDSFGKLAAPRLASASETSRETLVPMMDMLPTRGDWHNTSLVSHSTSGLSFRMCNCEQRDSGWGIKTMESTMRYLKPSRSPETHAKVNEVFDDLAG
jgi:hypothetical protein